MMTAVAVVVVAAIAGVFFGWLMTRSNQFHVYVPDPKVIEDFAARRQAVLREGKVEHELSKKEIVDSLRTMAR